MFACAAAAVLSLTTWAITRRRACLAQAGFFVFYIFDLADIFRNEWIAQNTTFDLSTYYAVEDPALRIVFAGALFGCLWLMLLEVLDESRASVKLVPVVALVVASALVVVLCPYGKWTQWLFYTLRQVFMAFALAYAAHVALRSPDAALRGRLLAMRGRFVILCLLVLAIFLEDSYVILALDPASTGSLLPLYLSERNFSENVLMVYLSWLVCRSSVSSLRTDR